MSKPVQFSFTAGAPVVVHVQHDGKVYDVKLQLSVLEVLSTNQKSSTGMPLFQMRINVATETTEVASAAEPAGDSVAPTMEGG